MQHNPGKVTALINSKMHALPRKVEVVAADIVKRQWSKHWVHATRVCTAVFITSLHILFPYLFLGNSKPFIAYSSPLNEITLEYQVYPVLVFFIISLCGCITYYYQPAAVQCRLNASAMDFEPVLSHTAVLKLVNSNLRSV